MAEDDKRQHLLWKGKQVNFGNFSALKGQANEIFDPHFFIIQPAWATDQQVKTLSILVKISPSYSNFYESPWGMIPRRVNLPGVSFPDESITPGYHTPASHLTFLDPN